MTDMQPKKMIILDILNILRKHSDEDTGFRNSRYRT